MPRRATLAAQQLPDGFSYIPDFLNQAEESELLRLFGILHFRPFDFNGYIARRRIIEYGWEYDFGTREATSAAEIPQFLSPVRERAASFAGVSGDELVEGVITEYPPGAPIGWH